MLVRITPMQVRAALGMLGWGHTDLSAATGITPVTISRITNGHHAPNETNEEKIRRAFAERDIMFLPNNGVAMYPAVIRKLTGPRALNELLDDVYETVKDGGNVCVTGTDETLYEKYHIEDVEGTHATRMAAIKDKVDFRVIIKHGDYNFLYNSYVQYRWMPEGKFKDNPFYLYNDKLAFIKVTKNGPEVWLYEMPSMAASFRDLFDVVWDQCSVPPQKKEV